MERVQVEIGANNRPLKNTLAESKGLLNRFGQDVASMRSLAALSLDSSGGGMAMLGLKGAAGVAGAAAVVGASLVKLASNTAEATVQAGKMAEQYGLSTEAFTRLAYAASLSNVSAEDLGKGMKGLSVKMREAANGSEEARAVFKALGVEYVDASGKLRPVESVLMDVANAFKRMPDGAEKAALATKLMEEAGIKLIPVLNQGADAIRIWGEEAKKLGLVVTPEQLKTAKEYEQNMKRLEAAATGLKREIGNEIVPSMAKFTSGLLENRGAGMTWAASFLAVFTGSDNPAKQIQNLTAQLAVLKAKQKEMADLGQAPAQGLLDNINGIEKAIAHYTQKMADEARKADIEAAKSAQNRVDIEQKAMDKRAAISRLLTYIQTGEGTKTEAAEKAATDRRIADQQRLIDAVRTAWKTTRDEADKARGEAKKLSVEGNDIGQQTQQQAQEIRYKSMSPEDVAFLKQRNLQNASDDASFASAVARSAAAGGDAKKFGQYADDAEKKLRAALQLANDVQDATKVEDLGKELQQLKEAGSKLKSKEADQLEERAASQANTLNELEAQLTRIQQEARAVEVKVELTQAKEALKEFEQQLAAIPDTKTTVLNVVTSGGVPPTSDGTPAPGTGEQFWRGGWTGPGGKYQPAGIVHAEEFVNRREVVRQPGALAFLTRFNQIGMRALQGYANGGLVQNLRIPSIPAQASTQSAGGTPITLVLDGHRVPVTASQSVASELTTLFAREALKRGGR